ncbi:hypothetical protein FBU30_001303 [Linnemannia zychae]|nr:hypothetical protein FBU30_001303 [Linnemannia zychae]
MPSAAFQAAVDKVNALTTAPSQSDLLALYGLYKQATVGPNTTSKPGLFDPKGRAKWDAWEANKALSQEKAEEEYIALANKLAP